MEYDEFELVRGKVYIVENYVLTKHYECMNGNLFLRCNQYRCKSVKCPVRGHAKDGVFTPLTPDLVHNHDAPSTHYLEQRQMMITMAKDPRNLQMTATDIARETRMKVLDKYAGDCERRRKELLAEMPSIDAMSKVAQRSRAALFPALPSDRQEIDFIQVATQLMTKEGSSFLVGDTGPNDPERVALFSTKRQLTLLARSKRLHIDGTFHSTPSLFYQLISIHGEYHGKDFALAYALLPKKDVPAYTKLFDLLCQALVQHGLPHHPNAGATWISDFETGLLATIRDYFPWMKRRGCFFHFSQAVWKEVAKKNKQAYSEDVMFRHRIKMVLGLAFVPWDKKVEVFWNNYNYLAADARVKEILDVYFVPYWLQPNRLQLWDWWLVEVRTNNHVEGWHSGLKRRYPHAHPNLWLFLTRLRDMANETLDSILDIEAGGNPSRKHPKYVSANRRLMRLCQRFHRVSSFEYLDEIAGCMPRAPASTGLPAI